MKIEDSLLLQRCNEAFNDLEQEYIAIDLDTTKLKQNQANHDIHLEIVTCENILKDCRLEVEQSSLQEIVENFSVVYHIDLLKAKEERTLGNLDEVTSKFLSSKKYDIKVDEEILAKFRKDMHLIGAIKDAVQLRISQLNKEKKWFFLSDRALISEYERVSVKFTTLQEKMSECFNFMSELVTTYIVESFHYIYLYFSYMIKYFIHTNNQLVLVEIAASIDRFIQVMQPLVKKTSLKNENLRNFYVIYELNLLKDKIFEHYE